MTVGVLAFQGDVREHHEALRALGAESIDVRSIDDLEKVDALIIPGGESTVMSRFLELTGVGTEIKRRGGEGSMPIYGTCAGAIIIAKKVTGKNVPSTLRLMNITIERNAYGTQMQSFHADLKIKGCQSPFPVAFIRAPVITSVGKDVDVLASHHGHPVLVREGNLLAGTFHPEVKGEVAVHRLFLAF